MASKRDGLEMSPEKALKLFEEGGVLIVLDLPVGSVFGIDMKVYQVGEKFMGLKMIPAGLHYVYFSAVGKDGSVAPRTGFFYFFKPHEVVMRKWDPLNEDLNSIDPTGEEKHRIRENLQNLDRHLGPYPYQTLKRWKRLVCNISESLVQKLQPMCGVVSSVTQLVPLSYPSAADSTSERKTLPQMKQVPGTEIRFTEIPKKKYPSGCSAAQITKHSLDSTYLLDQLLETYENPERDVLGELQLAHVSFLIAHVYDAFEHWKRLVRVFCRLDSGIEKYSPLLVTFLALLHYQLKEIPPDFFVDITVGSADHFLVENLQVFFENVEGGRASGELKEFSAKFRRNLTDTFKWDFESVPDDEQPVVVE